MAIIKHKGKYEISFGIGKHRSGTSTHWGEGVYKTRAEAKKQIKKDINVVSGMNPRPRKIR
jgi:hypothetical protein